MSLKTPRRAAIRAIASALPSARLDNDTLLKGVPKIQRERITQRTGVQVRHVAADAETALDLAETACDKLFGEHPDLRSRIDTLIFCTQSSDYVLPPNSCVLHGRLDLPETVTAFDIPHACSAYIYGLKLAQALIASGGATDVLLVNADTYTKFIHPMDRSTRTLFGDGAAATWLAAAEGDRGVRDVVCRTAGKHFDAFLIPAGGCRTPITDELRRDETRDAGGNMRSPAHIHMSGGDILSFVADRIPPHIDEVLRAGELTKADIDWFVFHQASAVVLDTLISLMELDPARVMRHLETVGNTVSASIPITLENALAAKRIRPGQRVLLCGFGVGLSWGTAIIDW